MAMKIEECQFLTSKQKKNEYQFKLALIHASHCIVTHDKQD